MILDSLTEKLEALESLPSRISSLKKLLQESTVQGVALQAEIVKQGQDHPRPEDQNQLIGTVQLQMKHRNNTHTDTVMKTVYQKALLPILEGARSSKLLTKIPAYGELLEKAHILPVKYTDRPKPIIASL